MRIGIAGCFHETNTFAPGKTGVDAFRKEWYVGAEAFRQAYQGTKTSMGAALDAGVRRGFEPVPLFYTNTTPSSMITAEAMDAMKTELEAQFRNEEGRLDGVLLILHGAMVSEGCPDADGELIRSVRGWIKDIPMAVTIDLHANVSEQMVANSDILVGYDTYPHVDAYDRGLEACELLVDTIQGHIHPVSVLARTNLLIAPTMMNTHIEPMRNIMEEAFRWEREERILNVSVVGGFAFADAPCTGMTVVVTTDGDQELAERCASKLIELANAHAELFHCHLLSVSEAVELAEASGEFPAILIESSDNVGGGSPADATHVLRYLTERQIPRFLIVIRDGEAVKQAVRLGQGMRFEGMIGGKTDSRFGSLPLHGDPVHIQGTIRKIADGCYIHQGPYMTGMKAAMGITAVVELEQLNAVVILTEERVAPWDINHVKVLGIDPSEFRYIVVKAAVAWRTAFGAIAKQVYELDTPGCCSSNLSYFTYRHVDPDIQIIA